MSKFTKYPKHGGEAKIKRVKQPKDYFAEMLKYRKNVYSQHGEDGVLEEIFKRLEISYGFACEFGAWDGKKNSNTFNLVEKGWNCLMIEGDERKFKDLLKVTQEYKNITPHCAYVSHIEGDQNSLNVIFDNHSLPKDFELLSIDVDSCDYQIWKSLKNYQPKVVIIEHSGLDMDVIYKFGAQHKLHLEGSTGFKPMKELGEEKGYCLLCDTYNLIFIRNDLKERFIA